ncbi:MAG: peptide ABC transporter permease [Lachnospiraceae bacterium]|nr:peptide ABC transporter permease [Lachnospiraceae bacterium]
MFISLMRKNSKKSHRENSIYFVSLIISIVAFYVILSLEKQDVMIFLKQMESNAVDRLFRLISGAYGFSLFLIFF